MKSIEFESAQNVKIEYELASSLQRTVAALLDAVLIALYIILLLIVIGSSGVDRYLLIELILIKMPLIFYHPVLEYLTQGQTLGKYIMGIRVVTYTGERPGLREIFTRWIFKGHFIWIGISFQNMFIGVPQAFAFGVVHLCIGFVGFIYASISKKKQRVGDVMAGTVVIKNKSSINYSLKDVLSIKNQENYTPEYPNAVRFTDEDMLLIKNAIKRVRSHPNTETKKFAIELADKSARLMGMEETPKKRMQFLQKLLQDYVVLTR